MLELRATRQSNDVVYTYLHDVEGKESSLTFGEVYDRAQRAATLMRQHASVGDRVILLFGSSLEFIVAFMGCQVAGVVPVPIMPPRENSQAELGRVMGNIGDAASRLIVTHKALIEMGRALLSASDMAWLSVEELEGVAKTPPVALGDAGELALLQYTSGSTSRPRGVMVGHDNLMQNLADIYWAEGSAPGLTSVSWLPMSHDMGLIEGVLQPLYRGGPVMLMSPLAFLRRPLRWLETISKYRAAISGGPNFAYDLVLRRLGSGPVPEELDLSCWRFAYNGSEPVSAESIQAFSERLACRGFRAESMHALFGIAEATLGVTEGRFQKPPRFQRRMGPGGERTVVSCGVTAAKMELLIVDPATLQVVAEGEEGEIWLRGPCVTRGYWRQPDKTREVFQGRLEGSETDYLRTGDLGFQVDGELYVSGRIKDLIICRGRNIHPQDMEVCAQKAHAIVRPGGVVAVAVPGREESAAVVAEIDKKAWAASPTEQQLAEAARELRRELSLTFGVPLALVGLVKPGTIPRTTSGKRQRLRVAKLLQGGKLDLVYALQPEPQTKDGASFEAQLCERVAALLGVDEASIDSSRTLPELGLDSLRTLELLMDVESQIPRASVADMLTRSLAQLAHGAEDAESEPWLSDAVLAEDIQCSEPVSKESCGKVLLTGATGFLGSHVAMRLLLTSSVTVIALVRGQTGRQRLLNKLRQMTGWVPAMESRIQVLSGDLAKPQLGLPPGMYEEITAPLDAIYHVASMVNWVYPYASLAAANVGGTQSMLRLACKGATPFVYVSTSAVCWSHGAADAFDEDSDPMSHVGGIYLNYVRSKAVAESLVRQAAQRGLAATVVRPGLIFSNGKTGEHSPGDFLSSLIKGCIEMAAAPDLNWSLEVAPVDDVARICVDHLRKTPGVTTVQVEAQRRRLWRGAVLWMILRGYDMELLDFDAWCQRLEAHATEPTAALRPLLSFFVRPLKGLEPLRLPQLYEEQRRNPMRSDRSRSLLAACPPRGLDAHLLDRTVTHLVQRGYLPAARSGPNQAAVDELSADAWQEMLRAHLGAPALQVSQCEELGWNEGSASDRSIIGELASWRFGRSSGLCRKRLAFSRGQGHEELDVVIKGQTPDWQTLDVGHAVARLCSPPLAEAWQQHRVHSEVCLSDRREAAVYALKDAPMVRHRPALYGAAPGVLLIEDLSETSLLLASDGGDWTKQHMQAAIDGIASIHAHWYGKPPTAAWLPPPRAHSEQHALWTSLAGVACEHGYAEWWGEAGLKRIGWLVEQVDAWSAALASMPATFIHNDFNPRNVALRKDGRLCAYDWELSRVGPAQRDLMEFLCFTLAPEVSEADLREWIDYHRRAIERHAGVTIDAETWSYGCGAALADFMVTRLPLYVMVRRFHPQPFLERVAKTCLRMDRLIGFSGLGAA